MQDFIRGLQWRTRLSGLALLVGLVCGCVCAAYTLVLEYLVDYVWIHPLPERFAETWFGSLLPSWAYIVIACTVLGFFSGLSIRLCGQPMANLPGVVKEIYDTGCIDHEDAPRMTIVSLINIVGAGSLGPEAPLVAIGGGLASLLAAVVEVSPAETLFITMCGMGAGLAAFFGEPVGGAIFACEVIHRWGAEYYEAFIPTVIAGVSCNMMFRLLLDLPQEAIWEVPEYARGAPNALTSFWGVPLGMFGGFCGWAWMKGTMVTRGAVMEKAGWGPYHVIKGTVGGLLIGLFGAMAPETLFWAEHEAQRIIDGGETPLPHLATNISTGMFGDYSLTDPRILFAIGVLKMVAISVTVLVGYRGGFIFPFMFAGISFGCCFAQLSITHLSADIHAQYGLHFAGAALGVAAAINASVTRTVLSTPLVLITLSSRPDVFPCVLISSIVSLYMTGDVAIIGAARKRFTREQLGAGNMTDCWSDVADKAIISRWRKGGTGLRRRGRGRTGAGGGIMSHRTSNETMASGFSTPTTAQVLQDPARAKWLANIVADLTAVKDKDDPVYALNLVLNPLRSELDAMQAMSRNMSANNSNAGSALNSPGNTLKGANNFKFLVTQPGAPGPNSPEARSNNSSARPSVDNKATINLTPDASRHNDDVHTAELQRPPSVRKDKELL